MCGYLLVRPDPLVLQCFEGFKCAPQPLFKSFLLLSILNGLRK
jgi:hypothetical protein